MICRINFRIKIEKIESIYFIYILRHLLIAITFNFILHAANGKCRRYKKLCSSHSFYISYDSASNPFWLWFYHI